ncbi:MAG: serine hydrolase [Ignavibacteria bacterium]|nr:serine hydrolase [Ignavibacteria bacterium]
MKLKLFTVLLLLFTYAKTYSQDFDKIEDLCKKLIAKYDLKGIGITGVKENNIIYTGTFGKANGISEFSDSTRIYIASNTKAFTALAIAKLVFENRISYTDPITNYIPVSFFPENIDADNLSIIDLLQHTHGLSNDPLVFRTAYSGEIPDDLEELLQFTSYRNDTVSKEFKYSNLGYLLAGIIIEKVSGLNWKEYLKKKIFEPVGMFHTSCEMNFSPELEALPYEFYSDEPLSSRKDESTLHSAGGIYSTLGDIGKWLTLFTGHDQPAFNNVLTDLYFNEKTSVGKQMGPFSMDHYGNGWIYGSLIGKKLYYHFGSFPGYESIMSFQPDNKTGVFVFVNERVGGQRIVSMLSAYFYLIEENDPEADIKIGMFNEFIDPLYAKVKKDRTLFEYHKPEELTGNYLSIKYGLLKIEKQSEGFIFTLGRLSSPAFSADKKDEFILEWTPGIEEHFSITKDSNKIKLIYDEFGEFIKQ